MDLPESVPMREAMHGHGRNGSAMYVLVDELELGIVQVTKRDAGNKPFESTFMLRWLPEETFTTYAALRIFATRLTDEAIAAEKAKWPQVTIDVGDHAANRCLRHRDRPSRNRGRVTTCWIPMLMDTCGLCQECSDAAAADPGVVPAIIEERRAYVASLPPIRERLGLKP